MTTQMPELPQAARLHMARYLAGLEMTELSRRTGISRSTIANYENMTWEKRRTPAYIRLWAMATGFPYEYLAMDVPSPGDGQSVLDRDNVQSTGLGRVVQIDPYRFRREAAAAVPAERKRTA